MATAPNQTTDKANEGPALLARLFWMVFGNAVIVFSLLIIAIHKQSFGEATDFVFWITVAILVLVRYFDIKRWNGLTVTGAPATIDHWHRYVQILLACSTIAWGLAHAYVYLVSSAA